VGKGSAARAKGGSGGAGRDARATDARAADLTAPGAKLKGVAGGRAALTPELDRIIHERLRLAIVSTLAVSESLSFNELKALLRTTDGNLSVHARKLEDAGYVACTKSFEDRIPRTEYRLTAAGRKALERYLDHMEALIKVARR
jgi:DNA-binding MarR family transcriptional regulator